MSMLRRLPRLAPLFALLLPATLASQGTVGDSARTAPARSAPQRADTVPRGDTTSRGARAGRTVPAIPSAAAARVAAPGRSRLPVLFYGALGAGTGVALALRFDPDTGGYRDGWATATDFPDKAVHALAAWAITSVGVDLGARPLHAGLAVCAAGTAFELAQGYVSPYDVAADCLGAGAAAAWHAWRARRARNRARAPSPQASPPPPAIVEPGTALRTITVPSLSSH